MKRKADLRVAIISDIHIGFTGHINPNYYGLGQQGSQEKWVEYALRWFKKKGVDVVVVPGDIANACAYFRTDITNEDCAFAEMRRFGEIFREVFKGTDVELVAIYGNHESGYGVLPKGVQAWEQLNGGTKTPWKDAFGEAYARTVVKNIKGYTFVGAHWGYEKETEKVIAEEAKKSPDNPVFYIQHNCIKDTTCDSYVCHTSENCEIINVIRDFDNVIALTGHTHCSITDERTIWQSAEENAPKCTVISCSTFNYADCTGDLVRGENLLTKHALYLTVSGKEINVERLSFYTEEMLALAKGEKTKQNMRACTKSAGKDWHFVLGGEKVMDFSLRAEKAKAPEFPNGAVAGLARGDTTAVVFFPAAIPPKGEDILHSYYAEAWETSSGKLVSTGQISTEFHVDASSDYFSPYYQITLVNLQPNTEYIFKVYARDCWQKQSEKPIIHKGRTLLKYEGRLR